MAEFWENITIWFNAFWENIVDTFLYIFCYIFTSLFTISKSLLQAAKENIPDWSDHYAALMGQVYTSADVMLPATEIIGCVTTYILVWINLYIITGIMKLFGRG